MTLTDFKNKYLGKQVEYHSFGTGALNQCIDLTNQYTVEVLGLTPIIGTNAKDAKDKYNPSEFEWIVNTPEAVIKKGDIPVWNGRVGGGAGHIAVALEDGNQTNFVSLDQNWSIKERVTIENHTYANVTGWLRSKKPVEEVNENDTRKEVQFDRITSLLHRISVLPTGRSEDYIEDDKLVDAVDRLHQADQGKAEEIKKLNEQISEYISEKAELQKAVVACQTEKEILTRAANEDAIHDRDAELKNMDLEKQLEELKKEQVAPIEPVIEHYETIIEKLWPNLFKGKKAKSISDKIWGWFS